MFHVTAVVLSTPFATACSRFFFYNLLHQLITNCTLFLVFVSSGGAAPSFATIDSICPHECWFFFAVFFVCFVFCLSLVALRCAPFFPRFSLQRVAVLFFVWLRCFSNMYSLCALFVVPFVHAIFLFYISIFLSDVKVLCMLVKGRMPELMRHFDDVDFSIDMVSERRLWG